VFKALFTEALKKVPGLEQFSHVDFPAMVAIDDSIWNVRGKNKRQRYNALAKLKSQLLTVMRPSSRLQKKLSQIQRKFFPIRP
jgi:hypothetical protein